MSERNKRIGARRLCANHLPEPFLTGQGGQEHGQDRLSGSRRDPDLAGGAELIRDKLDHLLEHAQRMKMGVREAVEFFSVRIDGRVLSIHKAEEVARYCRSPVCLLMGADLQGEGVRAGRNSPRNLSDPCRSGQ